jgi:hypothetical protein
MVPVLAPEQVKSPVLPALQMLISNGSPGVVKAGVKSLTALFASVTEKSCLDSMYKELLGVLERGPKLVGHIAHQCLLVVH